MKEKNNDDRNNNKITKTIVSKNASTINYFDPNNIIILLENGSLYQDLQMVPVYTYHLKTPHHYNLYP